MKGALLAGADLSGTNLTDANLEDANLQSARLTGTRFQGAQMKGANLTRAVTNGTDFNSPLMDGANLGGGRSKQMQLGGQDKHGLVHGCYNARLAIRASNGATIEFGLRNEDLAQFEAKSDEAEDIIFQVH